MILWFCYDPIEQKYENLALAKLSRAMMRYYLNEYVKRIFWYFQRLEQFLKNGSKRSKRIMTLWLFYQNDIINKSQSLQTSLCQNSIMTKEKQ